MFQATRVPMSCCMSNVTLVFKENKLRFRYNDQRYERFYVELPEDARIEVLPGKFTVRSGEGEFSVALYGKSTFLLRGTAPLTVRMFPQTDYDADFGLRFGDCVYLRDTCGERMHYITCRQGDMAFYQTRKHGAICAGDIHFVFTPGEDGVFEAVFTKRISQSGNYHEPAPSFDACVQAAADSFAEWERRLRPRDELDREAIFVLWANTLAPDGLMTLPAVCPGKNHMDRAWCHDGSLVAMALADGLPDLAAKQLLLNFDYIDDDGNLPDAIGGCEMIWNTTKVPLQGFALQYMLEKNPNILTPEQERQFYDVMSRNLQWWLTGREFAPCIWHGNEAGDDNSTSFDRYPAVQSPVLQAELALLSKQLSRLAERLGKPEDSQRYAEESKRLGAEITARFFDGKQLFVRPLDDLTPFYARSSYPYKALIGHEFMSGADREAIVRVIRETLLCDYGVVSEPIDSPDYIAGDYESYFRGSVWWSTQIMIVVALRQMGEKALADDIVSRYRKTLEKAGFREAANAENGEGTCLVGYSATAAAWLIISR